MLDAVMNSKATCGDIQSHVLVSHHLLESHISASVLLDQQPKIYCLFYLILLFITISLSAPQKNKK